MEGTQEQIPLQELAGKIAAALSEGQFLWKRDDESFKDDGRDWRAFLDGPSGLRLFLSNTWGPKGTLHISGCFPQGMGTDKHKINVSLARSPEIMAREIRRRLLPDYMLAFGIADRKKQENDAHAQARRETAKRFFDFLGEEVGRDPERLAFSFEGGNGEVRSPGEAHLILYAVPEETARGIIALLRSLETPLAEVNPKFAGLPNPITLANAEKARQETES
jgi:hypothetical protein